MLPLQYITVQYSKKVNNKICILCQIALPYGDQLSLLKLSSVYLAAGPLFSRIKKVIKTQIVNILNTSSGQCVKSSQVTFIYIALLTIQIVTKQLHNIKMCAPFNIITMAVNRMKCFRQSVNTNKGRAI